MLNKGEEFYFVFYYTESPVKGKITARADLNITLHILIYERLNSMIVVDQTGNVMMK